MMKFNIQLMAIHLLTLKLPQVLMTCFAILGAVTSIGYAQTARKKSKAKESKIARYQSMVEELETEYDQACETSKAELLKKMDDFIAYVDKTPGIAVDVRVSVLNELRTAKTSFQKQNSFSAIPAFQGIYQQFVLTRREKYLVLLQALEKLRAELPAADGRHAPLEKQIATVSENYAQFDSLKVGSEWVGYRSDLRCHPKLRWTLPSLARSICFVKFRASR